MSGGHFEYIQYRITDIVDSIQYEIDNSGKPLSKEQLKEMSWRGDDWYEKYPEDKFYYEYPEDIIAEFKKGIELLKMAQVYAHRIDWLLSGDDGEDSFRKRLKEDLDKIKQQDNGK